MKRVVTLTALVAAFALVARLVDADRPKSQIKPAASQSTSNIAIADEIVTISAQKAAAKTEGRFAKIVADNPELVPTLLSGIKDADNDSQTGQAYLLLMNLGRPTLLQLIKIAEGEDAELRQHAMAVLMYGAIKADFPLEAAVPAMLRLTKSKDEETAELAHYALRSMLLISSDENYRAKVTAMIQEEWFE